MLTGRTRLVGLIGDPVSHSLSPVMQNAAFAARGLDWAYVPLHVHRDRLAEAVAGLPALGFAGANVTAPHKTAVLAYCDELDDAAERAGSVNTLVVENGRVRGTTTDARPVVLAVAAAGADVLVLGSGGAAQAVATGLGDAGAARLRVAARHTDQAHALAARLRSVLPDVDVEAVEGWPPQESSATVVVNATPVVDAELVALKPEHEAVDLAYREDGVPTAFAAAAREAGCTTLVDGLDVLVGQGAASFELWTGVEAPVDVMAAAVRAVSR